MTEKLAQISLNELRDDTINSTSEVIFGKKVLGGYNTKEVSEYIKLLKESLNNAEYSFRNRLEEYAGMTAMLKEERDKYMILFKESESTNFEMQQRIITLIKDNDALSIKIQGMSNAVVFPNELQKCEKIRLENLELQNQIAEYKKYKLESIELKNQLDELKSMVVDINSEIENYAKNEVSKEQYETLVAENQRLKQEKEIEALEKAKISEERNTLLEENRKQSVNIREINEENNTLRSMNTMTKMKTSKMMAEFETRANECAENHRRNIDQISENIKNTLNILHRENGNIKNLISLPYEEYVFELESDN
ncbi:hypothetical protein [Acetobacterium bakii]|uniref:Uncharacterized protein n=1 Tax=Acetobacterium bakii TaxID=52689 RepID=A0A0L6TZD8_9FIRM|nr:hypothetical protein [Acetobacterium bakii]KNZ41641.1 hypothetical protein AKG39_10620 [Acetobacterium bakii]